MRKRTGASVRLMSSLAAIGMAAAVAGCGSTTSGAHSSDSSSGALSIWVDPPRVPAVRAFEKANPGIKVKINIISDNVGDDQMQGKFELFDQAGSGWPDVIYFPTNDDISWATEPSIDYAANLTKLIPSEIQKNFSTSANAPCVIGGQLRCIRDDDGAEVLWYNAALFKQWGYTAPTTWPEYEALGLQIARQHPGYYVGMLGDSYAEGRYLWPSECPTNLPLGGMKVEIDLNSPNCTRMVTLLDTLLKAKVLATSGITDSSTATSVGPKLVMEPGAEWEGAYLFDTTYHVPAGQITAGMPLTWPGEDVTGDEGGGMWTVSSHISGKLLANAVKFVEWASTSPKWQVQLSDGLPPYVPDQGPWLKKNVLDNPYYYAPDREAQAKAMAAAANMVWAGRSYTQYDTGGIWQSVVTPALTNGENLAQIWPTYQSQLVDQAKTYGYTVVTAPGS